MKFLVTVDSEKWAKIKKEFEGDWTDEQILENFLDEAMQNITFPVAKFDYTTIKWTIKKVER